MIGGFFLGTKGLLFLISGSNVLVLCFSIFLMNSGQSWVAARKFVLFGLLKVDDGEGGMQVVGPNSFHYQNLGIGEQIGGPFEDATGPAMNNFIKFVAVMAFVTGGPGETYDELPDNTWPLGFACIVGSIGLILLSQYGLSAVTKFVDQMVKRRERIKAFEEGDQTDQQGEEEEE